MIRFYLLTILLSFITLFTFSQTFRINEVMSSNGGVIKDSDNDTPDWIEFYNSGTSTVNLNGYGLSDAKDEPFKWIFPDFDDHGMMDKFRSRNKRGPLWEYLRY